MNPNEWNASDDRDYLYKEVMRRSQERFFVCECRFGTFKLRSALENVFVLMAHNYSAVRTLSYEKIRVPLASRKYVPDFLVNDEHLIECKATRDQNKREVIEKAVAGKRFAYERDWLYHMLDYDGFTEFFQLI